ncbi:MAG: DUF1343 domain-containing protein [Acidobacteria bacterium]|nr:MAG: DUF1343 domain-containing protein [Acidobacteriota bacterium]REK01419.1 MAG: DUF1343 domain-containing protein [Acidobacteriota bacterium]REK14375.1 MAG: DUF1343 domain-containing protein [Acidobacteriota bacterium]REK45090.1 MAG: DUF1343 domain-containing protein [Acidobacteriota bacterium]
MTVKLGISRLLEQPSEFVDDQRIGLICNQASVSPDFQHVADLMFNSKALKLTALFGPQHGIRGDVQDNMVETAHSVDPQTGLPVFSLYSETREPSAAMLNEVDALVFDLQDVGCRVYTFIYTMANAMRACANQGKRFIVCDRPNPIGGDLVEGALLEKGNESFVGQFPIPMRHGLTVGELAELFNREYGIGCDLSVVKMEGWARASGYEATGCSWVLPSPNIPTVDTAFVFPGTVYFEGTGISEGRGTTRPFEQVGAPYIDSEKLAAEMNRMNLEGVYFRPTVFLPTFQKHSGSPCGGVFLHVTDRRAFRPVLTGIAILSKILEMYSGKFAWKEPPYEYEYDRNPFDVIAGTTRLRQMIESGISAVDIAETWKEDESDFKRLRENYLLY